MASDGYSGTPDPAKSAEVGLPVDAQGFKTNDMGRGIDEFLSSLFGSNQARTDPPVGPNMPTTGDGRPFHAKGIQQGPGGDPFTEDDNLGIPLTQADRVPGIPETPAQLREGEIAGEGVGEGGLATFGRGNRSVQDNPNLGQEALLSAAGILSPLAIPALAPAAGGAAAEGGMGALFQHFLRQLMQGGQKALPGATAPKQIAGPLKMLMGP